MTTTISHEEFTKIMAYIETSFNFDKNDWRSFATSEIKNCMQSLWNEVQNQRSIKSAPAPTAPTAPSNTWDGIAPVISWVCEVPSATDPTVFHTVITPTVNGPV